MSLPERERPRFVMAYFDDPDATTHEFGPNSIESGIMIHYLDSLVGVMYRGLRSLPYGERINFIVTADHGMTDISDERFICINEVLDTTLCERIVSTNPTSIFTKPGCHETVLNALSKVDHIQAWAKEDVPEHLHYGSSPKLGDVIVAPDLGWQFAFQPRGLKGAHGYDPLEQDMQVMFRAGGPDFKNGYDSEEVFANTAVYPLLCHLLGVKPVPCDGELSRVKPLLR